MALSPMTLSQPQCSAVHRLATFSHVNKCEKTTALDGAHFYVFVRIIGHWRKLLQPCLEANLSSLRAASLPTYLLTCLPAYLPTYPPTVPTTHLHIRSDVKPHMTTKGTWHVAEDREQRANVKDRWQAKGTNKLNKPHQMSETKKKLKPSRTTKGEWHVAEGREQRASVKDRWQTKGTNQLNKPYQMSETKGM